MSGTSCIFSLLTHFFFSFFATFRFASLRFVPYIYGSAPFHLHRPMADADLTSPLLASDHIVVTVHSSAAPSADGNPYRALGCDDELVVPPPATLDPFRNGTPAVEGLYEWAKTVLCLPLALLRLALFGLCLAVGYVATKVALEGWKDKENPMPKWRCGVMWITRMCARCILFSFGYSSWFRIWFLFRLRFFNWF